MAASYHSLITQSLTDVEKRIVDKAVIRAAAPSADSALLGAVRLLQILKEAGLAITDDVATAILDPITTLDDWNLAVDGSKAMIVGSVVKDAHGRFRDGEIIHTSRLTSRERTLRPGDVVATRHSRYRLGRRATGLPPEHRSIIERAGYALAPVAVR